MDSGELRQVLLEVLGGPGQFDGRAANPDIFYLPLAREKAAVSIIFEHKRIVAIEAGPAFDPAQWQEVVRELDQQTARSCVGRDCSFSAYRVTGSWRGIRSGIQLLPPPSDAPAAPYVMAEHPFILEFPLVASERWPITNFRRMRGHRRVSFALNVLLRGGITTQPRRPRHLWAIPANAQLSEPVLWVQEFYFTNFGAVVADELTPPYGTIIEEIEASEYYAMRGHDGGPLRVPHDLDESLCCLRELGPADRSKFDNAAFWLETAWRQWTISTSATFASLAIAVEALGDRSPGASRRFREFIEHYAPGASSEARRLAMYEMRSDILHGTGLTEMDRGNYLSWAPPEQDERDLLDELWALTRVAFRNWLKSPAP